MTLSQQQQQVGNQQHNKSPTTSTAGTSNNNRGNNGAIVLVAKCPIPGKSKTRLIPLLGEQGSAKLSRAMLSDVLMTLDKCRSLQYILKILLYAPGNTEGLQMMKNILESLNLDVRTTIPEPPANDSNNAAADGKKNNMADPTISGSANRGWILLPMLSRDLRSSNLGQQLKRALEEARHLIHKYSLSDDRHHNKGQCDDAETQKTIDPNNRIHHDGSVVFLGMDAPELPLDDIVTGLSQPQQHIDFDSSSCVSTHSETAAVEASHANRSTSAALLCPADDGGYGMLCVPPCAASSIVFHGIQWSHPLTAVSQLKALSDHNVPIIIGKLMYDIDEPHDVAKFCQRLQLKQNNKQPLPTMTTKPTEQADKQISYDNEQKEKDNDLVLLHRSDATLQSNTTDSNAVSSDHEQCYYSRLALKELGQL